VFTTTASRRIVASEVRFEKMLRLVGERQVEREDAGLAEQFGRGELADAGSGEGRVIDEGIVCSELEAEDLGAREHRAGDDGRNRRWQR